MKDPEPGKRPENEVEFEKKPESSEVVGEASKGAKKGSTKSNPLYNFKPAACVQLGNGLWAEKIFNYLPDFYPEEKQDLARGSGGDEIQTEYFVPYADLPAALEAIYKVYPKIADVIVSSEVRQIAGDDIPLSYGKGGTRVAIHFVWKTDRPKKIMRGLAAVEGELAKFGTLPHFGKLFAHSPKEIQGLLGKDLDYLKMLMKRHDPEGKLRNAWVDHYFYS